MSAGFDEAGRSPTMRCVTGKCEANKPGETKEKESDLQPTLLNLAQRLRETTKWPF